MATRVPVPIRMCGRKAAKNAITLGSVRLVRAARARRRERVQQGGDPQGGRRNVSQHAQSRPQGGEQARPDATADGRSGEVGVVGAGSDRDQYHDGEEAAKRTFPRG